MMKKAIDDGKTDKELADLDFEEWVRHFRAFAQYRMLITPKRNHGVDVIVIQGPTGTGKTKWANDNYPNAYWKQRSQWWDGYAGEDTCIIDEFYGWLPFDLLLRICDRYPLMVESKGGQINFIAKRIVITSNSKPEQWYKSSIYFPSFIRRVNIWMVFPALEEPPLIHSNYDVIKNSFI